MHSGARNSLSDEFGSFEAVEDFSIFDGFSCCNEQNVEEDDKDLDDFILNDANDQQTNLLSVTYSYKLRVDGEFSPPVAFVSLANDSLKVRNVEHREQLGLGDLSYWEFPAVKICRLGVMHGFQRFGIGSSIINTVKRLFLVNNRTGCRYVTVDAYNKDRTLNFYRKNDFQFFYEKDAQKKTRSMYFDLFRFSTEIPRLPQGISTSS